MHVITGKRKRRSDRATQKDLLCHYRFTLKWDATGYFVMLGSGCANHVHHPKLSAEEIARQLAKENANIDDDDDDYNGDDDFPGLDESEDEGGSFHDAVYPSFIACCRALEGNFTENDVKRMKAFFNQLIKEKNEQQMLTANASSLFDGSIWMPSATAMQPNNHQQRYLGKRSSYYL